MNEKFRDDLSPEDRQLLIDTSSLANVRWWLAADPAIKPSEGLRDALKLTELVAVDTLEVVRGLGHHDAIQKQERVVALLRGINS